MAKTSKNDVAFSGGLGGNGMRAKRGIIQSLQKSQRVNIHLFYTSEN